MHELSIAIGIVQIAEDEAAKAGVSSFSAIDLEIGTMAGIEFEALDFAWPSAVKNTVLQDAERRIHKIPAMAACGDCQTEFPVKEVYDSCPACGSYLKNIFRGKELRVRSLDID